MSPRRAYEADFAVEPNSPWAIVVRGTVTDGAGEPLADTLIETWQIDGLFARCATDAAGGYEIHTRKPPSVPTLDGTPQAPHLSVSVFARGLLDRVVTRIYFADEPDANAADPTLAIVDPGRRPRLVAEPDADGVTVLTSDSKVTMNLFSSRSDREQA